MRGSYVLAVALLMVLLCGLELVSPVHGSVTGKGKGYRRPRDVAMNRRTLDFDGSSTGDAFFYAPLIVVIAAVGILGFFGFRDARKKRV